MKLQIRNLVSVGLTTALLSATVGLAPASADEAIDRSEFEIPGRAEPALLDASSPVEELVNEVLIENPELMKAPATEVAEIVIKGMDASVEVRLPDLQTQINQVLRVDDVASGETFESSKIEIVLKGSGNSLKTNSESKTAEISNAANGSTSLVESTEDGVRILVVLDDKSSTKKFEYQASRDGAPLKFMRTEDGVIYVGIGDEEDFLAIGLVEAPWAFDANGSKIPTEYIISGNGKTLTLKVKPTKATVYPVVADPSYTFWAGEVHCSWGSCTFYLERAKTYWIRDNGNSLGTTAFAAFLGRNLCTYVVAATSWSGWGAAIAGSACVVAVAATAWRIKEQAAYSWSCLTFKKSHWQGPGALLQWNNINHASGSNSHCHYNV